MITPWSADDRIDEDVVRRMVDFHVENGTSALYPVARPANRRHLAMTNSIE